MMRMQWVVPNFYLYLFWDFCFQTRVSRVLRASNGRNRASDVAALCRPAASSSSLHASALGGGFIPPPLSRLGIGFWYTFVPSSNGCFGRNAHPTSPPKPAKTAAVPPHRSPKIFLRKIFGKVTISVIYSVL